MRSGDEYQEDLHSPADMPDPEDPHHTEFWGSPWPQLDKLSRTCRPTFSCSKRFTRQSCRFSDPYLPLTPTSPGSARRPSRSFRYAHDVCLVHSCNPIPSILRSIVESVSSDSFRSFVSDELDRLNHTIDNLLTPIKNHRTHIRR